MLLNLNFFFLPFRLLLDSDRAQVWYRNVKWWKSALEANTRLTETVRCRACSWQVFLRLAFPPLSHFLLYDELSLRSISSKLSAIHAHILQKCPPYACICKTLRHTRTYTDWGILMAVFKGTQFQDPSSHISQSITK
jgi:hypothetical protein